MPKILVTGSRGFIGSELCKRLSSSNEVIGVDYSKDFASPKDFVTRQTDLTDFNEVNQVCKEHSPDVVIHCAGIAHQKIGAVDLSSYLRVNSEATENLAKSASSANPDVGFIFLSSVSVYGEDPQITQTSQIRVIRTNNNIAVNEESECNPSSDYAVSKLDAERRLIALLERGIIHDLIILRLAPVYDRDWSFNLDRRVLAPMKVVYIRFGSGMQKMSALARPNLVDFIAFLVHEYKRVSQTNGYKNNLINRRNLKINVCDAEAYEFNRIIEVFKKSAIRPSRPVVFVPLSAVWFATRITGYLFPGKKNWLHSCYEKLASSMIFDNTKMLKTGFKLRHSLQTIFSPTGKIKNLQ